MQEKQLPLTSAPDRIQSLKKGFYLTFEGPSCCGKSVQLKLLTSKLSNEGYPIVNTRQPGGTAIGLGIRQVLLSPDLRLRFKPKAESLLYWADRVQVHEEVVKPALENNCVVLGDRDFDSSIVYQCDARGLDLEWMKQMQKLAIGEFKPHKTILIMIPEAEFIRRSVARKQQSEQDSKEVRVEDGQRELFRAVYNGYLRILDEEPDRFILIDGNKAINEVEKEIYNAVKNVLADFS